MLIAFITWLLVSLLVGAAMADNSRNDREPFKEQLLSFVFGFIVWPAATIYVIYKAIKKDE